MRTWIFAALAILVLVPPIALAQEHPVFPPQVQVPPAPDRSPPRDPAIDRARSSERFAAIQAQARRLGAVVADSRTTPRPPDAIPENLRRDPRPQPPLTTPPPRRSEQDGVLHLLGVNAAPEDQSGVQCGSGMNWYQESYNVRRVRGLMFCHATDSFYTDQSMHAVQTVWLCIPGSYCFEGVGYDDFVCQRWAYDWQAWYCPMDTSYDWDYLYCPTWTRVLMYVTGLSPGGSPGYTYTNAQVPWAQGCLGA